MSYCCKSKTTMMSGNDIRTGSLIVICDMRINLTFNAKVLYINPTLDTANTRALIKCIR